MQIHTNTFIDPCEQNGTRNHCLNKTSQRRWTGVQKFDWHIILYRSDSKASRLQLITNGLMQHLYDAIGEASLSVCRYNDENAFEVLQH